jgi:hypothetical protein
MLIYSIQLRANVARNTFLLYQVKSWEVELKNIDLAADGGKEVVGLCGAEVS